MERIPNILAIAGSDPSGGAGIQADIKAISANGGYAMAALTALTAQNSKVISGVHIVAPEFVSAQIDAVLSDIHVDGIKIGMLGESAVIEAVVESIDDVRCPIVLDPVMISTSGNRLLVPDAVSSLRDILIPKVTIMTPNIPEAAALLSVEEAVDRAEMERQAEALLELGAEAVLLKGGHLSGPESPDLLMTTNGPHWFDAIRVDTSNNRGTGCTLASALTTQLAWTGDMVEAVRLAKAYMSQCLENSTGLTAGSGTASFNHFWMLKK